ncbi:hypothetical protein ACOME3_009501 [Neoechinorhynchus agilis]
MKDVEGLYILIGVSRRLEYFAEKQIFVSDIVRNRAKADPDKVCFLFNHETWTFKDVDRYANRVANYFRSKLKPNDVVGLLLDNCPQYPCIWLGLSRLGVVTALLNTKIKKDQYAHCLRTCKCSCLILGSNYIDLISPIQSIFECPFYILNLGDKDRTTGALDAAIDTGFSFILLNHFQDTGDDEVQDVEVTQRNLILLIFTSGTTGLPKAARISHSRFMLGAVGCFYGQKLNKTDVIYNTLPLYHALGGWICIGYALVLGARVVIRTKFSARNFWRDCVIYQCTAFIYIGELCGYILATKYSPYEELHTLRIAVGNGMRKSAWEDFIRRFKIPLIVEFYAATESNGYTFNFRGNPIGSCGFNSMILPHFLPLVLVKCDENTGDPVRNTESGFCIKCHPNQDGLLLSQITNDPKLRFDG